MQKRLLVAVCLNLLAFGCVTASIQGQELPLDLSAGEPHQIDLRSRGEERELVSQGGDPYIWLPIPALPEIGTPWYMELEYFCPRGIGGVELRLGQPARAEPFIPLPSIPPAEGWTSYIAKIDGLVEFARQNPKNMTMRLDLGNRHGVRLRVRKAMLRPMSEREKELEKAAAFLKADKQRRADALRKLWNRNWPATIESITHVGEDFAVAGHAESQAANLAGPLQLVAASIVDPAQTLAAIPLSLKADGSFEVRVAASQVAPWPVSLVAWRLERQLGNMPQAVSAARFGPVVSTELAQHLKPRPPRTSKKGITGLRSEIRPEQIRELGIQHGTINLVLTGLIDNDRQPGWEEFQSFGQSWWYSPSRVCDTDRVVQAATNAGVQVAGVLLILPDDSDLAHPEFDPAGHYAMPDFTNAQAITHYMATMDFLASRYSGAQKQFGRIDHWVVHNEVDYGWQWTNMGPQPLEVFMDHYTQALRIVDATTRHHNPHARTFISLTHRWNVPDKQPWRTYAPSKMLDLLLRATAREGDFPWGIAYHPYPESLWESRTWEDTRVDGSFDTELITMKNLPVLDRFVKTARARYEGEVRPVICSEQGFHAPEDDPQKLEDQCAALVYTWQQLDKCSSVLAFDYHRPIDHPREGGLRLGLRGLATKQDPQGVAKPAWEVFRKLDTPEEISLVEQFRNYWQPAK